jgi:acetyl-CoA carboxylase biotin carboxylase subunit
MRLKRALNEMVITGVDTTLPLFRDLVNEPDVINGDYSIHWLEQNLKAKTAAGV